VVDMQAAAISARLRAMSRLRQQAGFLDKRPAMTPDAITGRLRMLGALSDMCRILAAVGVRLRQRDGD
jgi:hypothetical protein